MGVFRAEDAFAVGEGLSVEGGGLLIFPQASQALGEVVAADESVGVLVAKMNCSSRQHVLNGIFRPHPALLERHRVMLEMWPGFVAVSCAVPGFRTTRWPGAGTATRPAGPRRTGSAGRMFGIAVLLGEALETGDRATVGALTCPVCGTAAFADAGRRREAVFCSARCRTLAWRVQADRRDPT